MSVLEVKDVVKKYGSFTAVDHVSFSIKKGEIFGLLGPNGAGKTTLISAIMTLENFTKGKISICGYDIKTHPRLAKSLTGFVPQELIAHGYFTTEEIIKYYAGFCGVWPDQKRIEHLLKRLFLWEHRHKRVRQLSGGMKRRLLIAKALIHSPKLLLLDEPTSGVDLDLRNIIWSFVKELREQGTSILFTTHYLEEAEKLCDRVAFIHHGTIRHIGDTKGLISHLTTRELGLKLKNKSKINHKYHSGNTEGFEMFTLPHNFKLAHLMKDLQLSIEDIEDIKIKEGSLEDVFKKVLKEKI